MANKPSGKPAPAKQPSKLAKYAKLSSRYNPNAVKWEEADASWLLDAVNAVAEEGGALILGKTRDGGALAITLLYEGAKTPFYANDRKSLYDVLKELAEVSSAP